MQSSKNLDTASIGKLFVYPVIGHGLTKGGTRRGGKFYQNGRPCHYLRGKAKANNSKDVTLRTHRNG
jgi:hypothetical protein